MLKKSMVLFYLVLAFFKSNMRSTFRAMLVRHGLRKSKSTIMTYKVFPSSKEVHCISHTQNEASKLPKKLEDVRRNLCFFSELNLPSAFSLTAAGFDYSFIVANEVFIKEWPQLFLHELGHAIYNDEEKFNEIEQEFEADRYAQGVDKSYIQEIIRFQETVKKISDESKLNKLLFEDMLDELEVRIWFLTIQGAKNKLNEEKNDKLENGSTGCSASSEIGPVFHYDLGEQPESQDAGNS